MTHCTCDWCVPCVPTEPRWGPRLQSSTPLHGLASSPAHAVSGSGRGRPAGRRRHRSAARNAQPAGSQETLIHTDTRVSGMVYPLKEDAKMSLITHHSQQQGSADIQVGSPSKKQRINHQHDRQQPGHSTTRPGTEKKVTSGSDQNGRSALCYFLVSGWTPWKY